MPDLPSNQSTVFTAGDNITIVFTETEGGYWDIEITGSAGGGSVAIQEEGVAVVAEASALNFDGDDFDIVDGGAGVATIDIAATHAGSTHSAATDTHIADTTDVHDHGSLSGLADDDHSQYRLESADHTHQSTGLQAGTLDHGLALTGLTDDDHTQYLKESVMSEANATDLTDGGETALHSHAGSGTTIDVQEEGVLEVAASALNFDGDDFDIADAGGGVAAIDIAATHAGSTHSAATDTHIADAADAHDASAISIADAGNDFTATDVEGALAELQADAELHDHWVNVKDFGALGDDSNDDSAEIQAAIDALNQGASNKGDVLYFPPGIYKISTTLDLGAKASIRILGGAAGITYNETPAFGAAIRWAGASGGVIMTMDGGASINQHGPTIENMAFVHSIGGAGSKCLQSIMTNHVTLRNCSFRGISGTNVEAGVVFNSQIDDHVGGDSAWHLIDQCVFRYCSTAINSRHSYGGTMVGGNIIVPASSVGVNLGTLGDPTNVATQNWRFLGVKMDGDTSAKGFTVDGGHNYFYGIVLEDMPTGFEFTRTAGVGQSGFRNVIYGASATNCTTFVSLAANTEDNIIAGLRGVSVTTFVSDSGTENVWRDIQDQADKLIFGEKYTDQSAPSSPPAGQIHLYSESGIFKSKDSGGTVRALADHTHASSGAQFGTIDHGVITGLTDDDHTQYRLESADHTHQSTGAQAGQLDHGLALTGLTDDDHTQYRLESADHTHQSTGAQAGTLDHGLALTGLTDDDHTQYLKESDVDAVTFSIGAFFDGDGSTLATGVRPVWRAPFACTVTQVRGYVDTGTTTVINASKDATGTNNFCSADITIDPADAWEAGTVNQNQSVASGDTVGVEIVTAGTATQLTIQIEFTRDLSP